ncbi:uncharacterized protein LOC100244716 isoform X1 [Vitis vinifera]|uniref:uncharacterized protein LOC100244716 isoform X1 n=1 Tax=Vitis vinifera TaxID=29760 RepID=UPI002882EBDF|nr:uncharacterized protein LOC100244716 isoform X1 [Vitis vinifera]
MIKLSRKVFYVKLRRRLLCRVSLLGRCLMRLWDRFLLISRPKSIKYKQLLRATTFAAKPVPSATTPAFPPPPPPPPPLPPPALQSSGEAGFARCRERDKDSDLVALKISLLGDCQIGKTSFVIKYVGNEKEQGDIQTSGINLMDKTLYVGGARISYSIWEVGGDEKAHNHIPMACKDSVAILYMFDLTSRCTLNSVISWYHQARKWNQVLTFDSLLCFSSSFRLTFFSLSRLFLLLQNAIPVLIGTKFDDFIQLPIDLQWTVASQVNFSTSIHNFKVVMTIEPNVGGWESVITNGMT